KIVLKYRYFAWGYFGTFSLPPGAPIKAPAIFFDEARRFLADLLRICGVCIDLDDSLAADPVHLLPDGHWRASDTGLNNPKITDHRVALGGTVLVSSPADFGKLIAE